MRRNWYVWLRNWLAWGRRRLNGKTFGILPRSRLGHTFLEDRIAPAVEPAFRGGLAVTVGDVSGEGIPDLIGAPSASSPPQAVVYSGANGEPIQSFLTHESTFLGGVFLSVGDVDGTKTLRVVSGAGSGGGPRVTVVDPRSGETLSSFFAYDPSFSGGVRVAVADLDGDGKAEIVTSPGEGGGPHIRVFDATGQNLGRDFMAYDPSFRGGVTVAAADTDGDGLADIVTAPGVGGGPHVTIFSGATGTVLQSFFAADPLDRRGIWVAAGDVDGNGLSDVVTGSGAGRESQVRVFAGTGTAFAEWNVYEPTFQGGVHVAAGDVNGDGFADVMTGPGIGGGPRVTMWDGYRFTREQDVYAVTDGQPLGFGLKAPALRTPLFDGATFVVPGAAGTRVKVASDVLRRFTDLPGEVGVFRVDDREGRVGELRPGDPTYGSTALEADRRIRFFGPTAQPGSGAEFELEAGQRYGFYLIRGGSYEDWAAKEFSDAFELGAVFAFPAANPNGATQFRAGPRNRAAFEDVAGLDDDFNDVIVDVRLADERSDSDSNPTGPLPVNVPPDAVNDEATTAFQTPVVVDVLANDHDPDGQPLTVSAVSPPVHGTARVIDNRVEYTPATDFVGVDSFTYSISDGHGGTDTAGVTVTVVPPTVPPAGNRPPVASDDQATTTSAAPVLIEVLANDGDPDGDALTVVSTTAPANGRINLVGNKIEYVPNDGFQGVDTFTYTVADGRGGEDTAGVTVTVVPPTVPPAGNRPPVANDDEAMTAAGTAVLIEVLANDGDPDGDSLTVASATAAANGRVNVVGNRVEYVPNDGFRGVDTFTYTADDGRGGEDNATVEVFVDTPVANAPPVATDDAGTTPFETPVVIDVLANDRDPDGDPLTVAIAGNPRSGSVRVLNNQVEYTPGDGFTGVDSFTYAIRDERGGAATAQVRVTVQPPTVAPNRAPDAVNDDARTMFQTPVVIDVLANDTDPDGDPLTASVAVGPAHGTVRLVGNKVEYTPDNGFTGVDLFLYAVADGRGGGDRASVMVTVEPAPVDFTDWTAAERGGSAGSRGSATLSKATAVLREGDSFISSLSKSFVIPEGPSSISFTYSDLGFDDTANGFVNDAFEASLVDRDGTPLVPAYAAGRDAFFNVTDGNSVATGSGVTVQGGTVAVDISQVPAGTVATLVLRMVNNDADTGSAVTLSGYSLPNAVEAEAPVKFFVADDGSDRTYRYGEEGLAAGEFDLGNTSSPRGAASNPAGDRVWLVDSGTKQVTVFDAAGTVKGAWAATDAVDPQGVTVSNGDLWVVDRGSLRVLRYVGGAVRTSGSAASTSSFALAAENGSPSDLVTDGATVYVTDDARKEVFVYDVAGTSLGRWQLDGDNASPSGITKDPAGGTDLWVLDRGTKQVFHYPDGANLRGGQVVAAGTFNLGKDTVSPEGIADPPPVEIHPPTLSAGISIPQGRIEPNTFVTINGSAIAEPVISSRDNQHTPVLYNGFEDLSRLVVNGDAKSTDTRDGTVLRLTSASAIQSGNIFSSKQILATSFSTFFSFRISDPGGVGFDGSGQSGADGFVFVIQSVSASLGGGGGGIGYSGIPHSVGVEFDTFRNSVFNDPDSNHIGIDTNGNLDHGPGAPFTVSVPTRFDDGEQWFAWVDYDGTTLEIRISQADNRPVLPSLSRVIDIPEILGGSAGYLGFTSGTGLDWGNHDILSWEYRDSYNPIESGIPNRIISVSVNGVPVEALDEGGNFWDRREVLPGENAFHVLATDLYGQEVATDLVVVATKLPDTVDSTQFVDLSATFKAEYARTSFDEDSRSLYAQIAVRNAGNYPASVPLYVAVKNISDPTVKVLEAAGTLDDGTPYYDFTSLVTGGGRLEPSAATGQLDLAFDVPSRKRFTYDLVFLGVLNRPPAFTTVPLLEAHPSRSYAYKAAANDPDGDILNYSVITGPEGLTVDAARGVVQWTPAADQLGSFDVTLRANDGRGGTVEQRFAVGSTVAPPNRPPVFTSEPGDEAEVGEGYRYDADALDPDQDSVTFALVQGSPAGMVIDAKSGLITWTPVGSQVGHADVTVAVSDGHGGTATQAFEVCVNAANNRAPVIVTTPVTTVRLTPSASPGHVIVTNDEWTLSEVGFSNAPATGQFVRNVATYFTGGGVGRFLAYSSNFGLTGNSLAATMAAAGHSWTVSTTVPFTLDSLRQYDGVFVGGISADPAVLSAYVAAGGNVYLLAGTGTTGEFGVAAAESAAWEPFLTPLGLRLASNYNQITGNMPTGGTGPLFASVPALFQDNGQSILDLDPAGGGKILASAAGQGLCAVYEQVADSGPNLLVNGDFEQGPDPGAFSNLMAGSPDLIGWTVGGVEVNYVGSLWQQTSGSRSIDLDGNSRPGSVSQQFATVPGRQYAVTFRMSGNPNAAPTTKPMRVSAAGVSADFTFDTTGSSYGNMRWSDRSWQFVATETTTTLTLASQIPVAQGGAGPVIDAVQVHVLVPTVTYTYDVDALDPDGGPTMYSLTQAPQGMTIDSVTGFITWAPSLGSNRVVNGDFEQGNTGFSTELRNDIFPASDGFYAIGHDPFAVYGSINGSVGSYGDHTTGKGLMMVVNGSRDPAAVNWQQSVSVEPNKTYEFFAWASTTYDVAPAQLRFKINGDTVGEPLVLPSVEGEWQRFYTRWHSGSATSATIQITNDQGAFIGNDFALDDIGFAEVISSGPYPVTVRADDGRGGSDEQSFTVTVVGDAGGREFDPVVEWHKDTFAVRPDSNQVMMTPAVIDLNGDGTPDIVFSTFTGGGFGGGGVLRAVSGRDGTDLWSVVAAGFETAPGAQVAIGNLDADASPEVVAVLDSYQLAAFDADGTPLWTSPVVWSGENYGAPSIADIDGDGVPEVVFGATVLNADGTRRWRGDAGAGSIGFGPYSAVADLDRDGVPEIVAGRTAYRADGTVYWSLPGADGIPAIGNFDEDPFPEIVLTGDGFVRLVQHDGTLTWTVPLAGGGRGGSPTIADLDGDDLPEIGVAGGSRYVAYRADGSILWQAPTQDLSSNATGSSVFDFDGDGIAEVVYADELFLRIYRGTDGTVLYELPNPSGTLFEYPVITDVDGDGNAEIIVPANNYYYAGATGIRVIGDRNNTWVNTRQVWNQHSYHITNVNDDGTIPAHERNSWETYNTYRLNVLTSGFDPRSAADWVVTGVTQAASNGSVTFTATVRNDGSPVLPGVSVAFFDGDPARGGQLLGTRLTATRLTRGQTEGVSFAVPAGSVNDLWVRADDGGTGVGTVSEFDESNNAFRAGVDLDPVNYAPRLTRDLTPAELSVTARVAYRLTLPVLDPDGDAMTFAVVAGPAGLMVHPTLGVVAWYPVRDQIGTHQVIVLAQDDHGNATLRTLDFTIVAPNTAPVVTSNAPAGPTAVGLPYHYAVTAQDAEQTTLGFAIVNPAPGMAVDSTGAFSWTPSSSDIGTKAVTVRVTDGVGGITDHTFTITVVPAATNTAPVAGLDARSAAWLGRDYVGRVAASDADGDPLSYSLTNAPTGMLIDAAGVIHWHPAEVTTSPYPITVRVSDGRTGGEVVVSYSLSVVANGSNAAPVITSVPRVVATAESPYSYDLVARDADGDPVFWTLVAGPQGMSLDALRGTLRWVPEHDQTGPASVTVRVTDAYGATAEQSFAIEVACINQPPRITSIPVTVANANFLYISAVRATDPDGDPLTFNFDQAPAGMTFVPGTSIVRWLPTAAQVGPQTVTVRVMDQAGNFATQTFTIQVDSRAPNRSPVITSTAQTVATLGQEYRVDVTANDPDGDSLTFELTAAPAGMTIDSTTGHITWLATEAGKSTVTVAVTDGRGGRGVQTYTVTARTNQAPVLAAIPDQSVAAGAPFRLNVSATDPDGDAISYRFVQAPTGMTIDSFGRITWQSNAPPRPETITVAATDIGGLSASRTFTLTLTSDNQAPNVTVFVSPNVVNQGQMVVVQVSATDNVGVAARSLSVVQGGTMTPLAVTPQGRATFTPTSAGRYSFVAVATDTAGNQGRSTAELRAIDPNDQTGPTVAFNRLVEILPNNQTRIFDPNSVTASVGSLTDVFATIHDPDGGVDNWIVRIARADQVDYQNIYIDDPVWRTIGTGMGEVANGKIATFDPTVLTNDRYVLAVVAYDVNGQGTVRGIEIDVSGGAKLGEFTLTFTDLSLPLNGIPIEVTRVYDSREAGTAGDFGYGWRLGLRDAHIRETLPPGPGNGLFSDAQPFRTGTKVYLDLPDGRRAGFKFSPEVVNAGLIFGTYAAPKFVTDPGFEGYRLEVDGTNIQQRADGTWALFPAAFSLDYNPDNYRLITPDGLTYFYNQQAGLQKIRDLNNNEVTFSPNGIAHSGGRRIDFVRDGQGRITDIVDAAGKTIHYSYDAAGDLRTFTDQVNATTQFKYNPARPHYLDEIIDPLGRRAVKTEYDTAGRVVALTDANGNRVVQEFDPLNFRETVRDARGNPTYLTYDARGNVTRKETPTEFGPVVEQYFYADPNNPDKETKVVNPRGFATTKTYDARGNELTETTPDGTTAYTFNAANKLTSVTDPLGRTTAYDYSAQGNLVRVVNPLGDDSVFTYDGLGRVASYEDFNGNTTMFLDYCACGRPKTIQNPDGSIRRLETNGFSQITQVTDEVGNVTRNVYDDVGRLTKVIDGEGNATSYEYQTGTANVVTITDPLGNVTRYQYDGANNKTQITDAEGGVTRFAYDKANNLVSVTDPVNNVTTFVYDAAIRLKQEIDPLGLSRYYTLDAAGNKTAILDRNNRTRTFEYDAMNHNTAEKWLAADGSVIRVIDSTYDKAGNLLTASDPDAKLGYTYDAQNRVKTATTEYPGTNVPVTTLTYGYDKDGNTTSVVDNFGVRVDSTYSDRNELQSRTMQGGGVTPARAEFEYADNGERTLLERFSDASGTSLIGSTSYDYFKNGLSKTITHENAAGVVLVNFGYLYDSAGRLKQEVHRGNTYGYSYDRLGQLLSVVKNDLTIESFAYDANGNRIFATGATAGIYTTLAGNRYSTDGRFSYTYDNEGSLATKTDLTNGGVVEYTWDYRNRLTTVKEHDGNGVTTAFTEYAYDETGRRVAQRLNTASVYFVYNKDNVWSDLSASGSVDSVYMFTDAVDEVVEKWQSTGGPIWYLSDRQGSVVGLINSLGVPTSDSTYSSYGLDLQQSTNQIGHDYSYTGRENATGGLIYYRSRFYLPLTGRFISEDTIGFLGGDLNLYRYTVNSPTNGIDPLGTSAEYSISQKALGSVASLALQQSGRNIARQFLLSSFADNVAILANSGSSAIARAAAQTEIRNTIAFFLTRTPESYKSEAIMIVNALRNQIGRLIGFDNVPF